jgi:teichuronic acid biosynthesis glycosyltransferase TuaH
MNRNVDIICLTLSRWDDEISSPSLSLAKEFAKNNRVFYIDHPFSWKDYFTYRKTEAIQNRKEALLEGKNIYTNPPALPENITIVNSRLTLPINFLPEGKIYEQLSRYNDKIVLNTIRQLIKDFQLKDFIYINFFDPYFVRKLPADIKPLRTVYQCMDDISQVDYSKRHGEKLEAEIVSNFDYTLCTSKELTRLMSAHSPNAHFHPNAADINIFRKANTEVFPKPEELKNYDQKIIGYTGSIEYRTDFELLKKVALYHKDKILFLIGPIRTSEHTDIGLDKLPNVVFAGPRKITQLPAYLQHFDCAIIPFKKTVLTKSIYPLKINEYLSAGKPVIATHFSDDIYTFRNVAYIAEDHEEFLTTIDKAIAENNEEKKQARIAVAETNTWTARVAQFWEIIEKEPVKKGELVN